MVRQLIAPILGITMATGAAFAGQIPIGLASGLTAAYVTPNGGSPSACAGSQIAYNPGFTGCSVIPTTQTVGNGANFQFSSKSYSSSIFGATAGPATLVGGAPAMPAPGATLTDGTATFNLSNEGTTSARALGDFGTDGAGQAVAGDYSLVIPVGIKDVDRVWTMIQDYWGVAGSATSVEFDFSSTSNGSGGIIADVVTLVYGQTIRSSTDCTTGNVTDSSLSGSTACSSHPFANTLTQTVPVAGQGTLHDVSLSASNVYSAGYTATGNSTFTGTTGTLLLDDQSFNFGTSHLGQYLVQIIIKNSLAPGLSKIDVSAVTVSQVTPEPSTVLMFLTGFGALGVSRLRRRK